jgi:acyl-CoA thioesterase-2
MPSIEDDVGLLDLLELEAIEQNLYRANTVFADEFSLYGGQVAAQALLAAGQTVDAARRPHSLHGYFLRPGDAQRPTVFKVYRDRDGGSFSARRVVAIQQGEVIFNMSASFHRVVESWSDQAVPMPVTEPPQASKPTRLPRMFSIETMVPTQPYSGRTPWPTRFWSRVEEPLPADPLIQACALTYLSDISTGVLPAPDGSAQSRSSLDHAVWFHGDVDLNSWVLSDYEPRFSGRGRGLYAGSFFDETGRLIASVAQETLFR